MLKVMSGAATPTLSQLLRKIVPLCFVMGAGLELFMVKVDIRGTNFYGTAKRKAAERRDEKLRERERSKLSNTEDPERLERRRKALALANEK